MALSKQQLHRKNAALPTRQVDVPEWSEDGESKVLIRMMSGLAMSRLQARADVPVEGAVTGDNFALQYVAASIIDPATGELVFDSPEETALLAAKDGRGLRRVYHAALELNGDTKAAAEELEKNSGTTPAGASGGARPGTSVGPIQT